MIISFSASVTGINTLLSKKFAWKINDLSTENLLDPVLNYTETLPQFSYFNIAPMHACPYIVDQPQRRSVASRNHSSVSFDQFMCQ